MGAHVHQEFVGMAIERTSPIILIVDDSTVFLTLAEEFLAEAGYRVFTCPDGERALQMVREIRPDLVILDVVMPHLGGFGILYALSGDALTRNIPVLICSALPNDEVAAWQGMFATSRVLSIPKPDDWPAFVSQVAMQLTTH